MRQTQISFKYLFLMELMLLKLDSNHTVNTQLSHNKSRK